MLVQCSVQCQPYLKVYLKVLQNCARFKSEETQWNYCLWKCVFLRLSWQHRKTRNEWKGERMKKALKFLVWISPSQTKPSIPRRRRISAGLSGWNKALPCSPAAIAGRYIDQTCSHTVQRCSLEANAYRIPNRNWFMFTFTPLFRDFAILNYSSWDLRFCTYFKRSRWQRSENSRKTPIPCVEHHFAFNSSYFRITRFPRLLSDF